MLIEDCKLKGSSVYYDAEKHIPADYLLEVLSKVNKKIKHHTIKVEKIPSSIFDINKPEILEFDVEGQFAWCDIATANRLISLTSDKLLIGYISDRQHIFLQLANYEYAKPHIPVLTLEDIDKLKEVLKDEQEGKEAKFVIKGVYPTITDEMINSNTLHYLYKDNTITVKKTKEGLLIKNVNILI